MNVALTTSHERMAPCFSGVELRVVGPQSDLETAKVVVTRAWHPLVWGRELMRRDVNTLLCAGIDQVVWAGIRGYGIQVIPNTLGDPAEVLNQWSAGRLAVPQTWPMLPGMPDPDRGKGGGRRRRFRGGRG
jgi:hypothetical protein